MGKRKCILEMKDKKEDAIHVEYTNVTGTKCKGSLCIDDFVTRVLDRLDHWLDKETLNERDDLKVVGEYLYNTLFPKDSNIRTLFEADYDFVHRDFVREKKDRLLFTLVFRKMVGKFADYPWEFLYMPERKPTKEKPRCEGFFLAGEQTDLILTRFVPEVEPHFGDLEKELRILIVFSHPEMPHWDDIDTAPTRHAMNVIEALERPGSSVRVKKWENPTYIELFNFFNEPPPPGQEAFRPHIVHFIGHGDSKLGLALTMTAEQRKQREDDGLDDTEGVWYDSDDIIKLFSAEPPPRLVFLQACESARRPDAQGEFCDVCDLARGLASARIPAVVAMQYEIRTTDAARFAREFYTQLSQGHDVDEAVRSGRAIMGISGSGGRGIWSDRNFGIPVLYLQTEEAIVTVPLEFDPEQRVPCPNPRCVGSKIALGWVACPACGHSVGLCPHCKQNTPPVLMDKTLGMCRRCGYRPPGVQTATIPPGEVLPPGTDDALPAAGPQAQGRLPEENTV